ncbi:MAG: pyruvate kinase [Methyloglobulus sp.]|nr:pyruvate kinase [Methyloglobulus sp.]
MATAHKITEDPFADTLKQILVELISLREKIQVHTSQSLQKYQQHFHSGLFSKSAFNLAHYLALRQFDFRLLHERLVNAGIPSLGYAEVSVLATLDSLIDLLSRATCIGYQPKKNPHKFGHSSGQQLLDQHCTNLLGSFHDHAKARVMVTLGSEAAWNYALIINLLKKGMTCARINCIHDDSKVWQGIIGNVRKAETETGQTCRIMMELAGHKIRTGAIALEAPVHHVKVKKDRAGKTIASGYLILTVDLKNAPTETSLFRIPIFKDLHKKLAPGMFLGFIDNQEKQRYLKVEKALSCNDWLVSCEKSAYLVSGSPLRLLTSEKLENKNTRAAYKLGKFDGEPLVIRLKKDDLLLLTANHFLGKPAEYSATGVLVQPAHIGCTLSKVLTKLEVGHPVWIDSGKLGAVVENINDQGALLRITVAKHGGIKIHSDKSIIFPETELGLPPLSKKDLTDLDFVCEYADMVCSSSTETLAEMECLMSELEKRKASKLPIIARIETKKAVKNLPDVLLGTIGRHSLGIMNAWSEPDMVLDGARLPGIQEEILGLCEAAHVPVISATQVSEAIAKKGMRSIPEFSDMAIAARADCIMLNKGSYVLEAIDALVNVMTRINEYQKGRFSGLTAFEW